MRDIAEIERARDALAALPLAASFRRGAHAGAHAGALAHHRYGAGGVGGVLALVMLTVFGAAAAMTKLAR